MLNVSPIGRNCSQAEREAFLAYDTEHKIRERFIEVLKKQFHDYGFHYSIGGQISFDVFPEVHQILTIEFIRDGIKRIALIF